MAQPHRVLSYVGCQEIYEVESSVDSVLENVTTIGKRIDADIRWFYADGYSQITWS